MKQCCDPKINAALLTYAPVKMVASAVLVDCDGRVLISRRPKNKEMEGLWEFPGGKIEDNETPEIAIVRELEEEIGIKTCAGCLMPLTFASYRYDRFHLVMTVFVCRQWENIPVAKEGQDLKWVPPKELLSYEMPEANRLLVTAVRDLH